MANEHDRLQKLIENPFISSPGEYLAIAIVGQLIKEKHFTKVFGKAIDPYDREDYAIRELPALRVYVLNYTKEQESHYINGEVHLDVILPASIRRIETELLPSRISSALLQQFRREGFFETMQGLVPGLNELGKVFHVDKNLTFQNTAMTDECPVVKITLNFRIDLKVWDDYLEEQGRTKGDPFDVTLEDLDRIATKIQGLDENENVKIEIDDVQTIGD